MNNFIYETILSLQYFGISVLMIFFSGEAVMPFVGYKASLGSINLFIAAFAGAIGSAVGSTGVYLIARLLNKQTSTAFLSKYGKWLGINAKKIDRAGLLFDSHARRTVFIGRFIPGVRTAVSIPAGYQQMPIGTFMLFTFMGSAVSAAILAGFGYYLGIGFARVEGFSTIFTYSIAALIVLLVIYLIVKQRRLSKSD